MVRLSVHLYRRSVSQSSEFAAINLCVASQRVFIVTVVAVISLSTQSGNFWIHSRMCENRYEGVFKSFRTGLLERQLQMVQLCATRCSCIAIL
jgi:hypothetical protein